MNLSMLFSDWTRSSRVYFWTGSGVEPYCERARAGCQRALRRGVEGSERGRTDCKAAGALA